MKTKNLPLFFLSFMLLSSCNFQNKERTEPEIPVIIDTDANNELDDQHALAYAFCNADVFDILGVTVNSTRVGGGIEGHYLEAERITRLCKAYGIVPLINGAEATYNEIKGNVQSEYFDGKDAVDFIVEQSKKFNREEKLLIIALGKLTNVALAIEKDSSIVDRVKLLWLGSNYPDPGEYNLENDTSALNPVFQSGMQTEIALVAYGRPDGTDAVKVPIKDIEQIMPGLGPQISDSIEGRNGGYYQNFGDYAVNLWQNIDLYGEQQSRALFDLAAVAIVKEPSWAQKKSIEAPYWNNGQWDLAYDSQFTTGFYYNFEADSIIDDFISSLKSPSIIKK
jgi:inosine-uridine nucleoside N-ribohydrolase